MFVTKNCLTHTLLFTSVLLLLGGCSKGRIPPDGMPKLYHCTVLVTQEGMPLENAFVGLHSKTAPLSWTVGGKTDAAGKAEIFTHGYFTGAPLGDYVVTVRKTETVSPPLPDELPTSETELTKLYSRLEEETRNYDLVEPEYAEAETTPRVISVEKKNINTILDVGKKYYELAR